MDIEKFITYVSIAGKIVEHKKWEDARISQTIYGFSVKCQLKNHLISFRYLARHPDAKPIFITGSTASTTGHGTSLQTHATFEHLLDTLGINNAN